MLSGVAALASLLGRTAFATNFDCGGGLEVVVSDGAAESGAYRVEIDGQLWLDGDQLRPASYFGSAPKFHTARKSESSDPTFGPSTELTLTWVDSASRVLPWETSFITYRSAPGVAVFRQTFLESVENTPEAWSNSSRCGEPLEHYDQTGGSMIESIWNVSRQECCDRCTSDSRCNAYLMEFPINDTLSRCWTIDGAKGTYARQERVLYRSQIRNQNSVLAGFPAFLNGKADVALNTITWGGCQLSPGYGEEGTHLGHWTNTTSSGSATQGLPLLLYSKSGRTAIISPSTNFFVAVHEAQAGSDLFSAGIKASVTTIPKGFSHDTVIFTGHGINDTLVAWGDLLLAKGGKRGRVDPYADFILGHLGHWNDAGAYYYHNKAPYKTYEDALLDVKADAKARSIPFRYSQWDDWWAYQKGDFVSADRTLAGGGGLQYWWPKPDVFPSGLTDWLGLPLALYAPGYSADNVYRDAYDWKTDSTDHALPIDRHFYDDIFANGTKAGMVMFEQDFMCSINTATSLTNDDVTSGAKWLEAMDAAATDANISLQFCMMNPIHTLASSTVRMVTNGRATRDNHPGQHRDVKKDPGNAGFGLVLGVSGLLHYAMGIWPSRDNVWTNRSVDDHGGPERMPETQNLMALLSGGPYGPSDGAGAGNRSLIMRSCRDDGVLLRADKPITMLDKAITSVSFEASEPVEAINVWTTHSQVEELRWGYVLALNTEEEFELTPRDIYPAATADAEYVMWEYWGGPEAHVQRFSAANPFVVPATGRPSDDTVIASGYHVAAPVLANGWAYLGEPGKIVAASARRVASVRAVDDGFSARLRGSASETITAAVLVPDGSVIAVSCVFGDRLAGDGDSEVTLHCSHGACQCGSHTSVV